MWLLWVIGGQQGDSLLLMEKKKQMSELETKKYAKASRTYGSQNRYLLRKYAVF